ncbi:malto-oligosyltrehalose synthase [Actinomadura harenae]|uniref:Malto-oligosyltrehalose synthase n=1 Tax=Actinomadura harenae TaxID=2483351 RepID=A0A3M2MDJ8_9ACTN|nr:malto-oligosyltrehalose synthase [Actinomadura harenae]
MDAPSGTYRLQLTPPRFGFAEAAALAPYLKDLGVSHVHLSPVLQAAPGSTHGYDVVDHGRISAELGGEDAFTAMVGRFRSQGLRVLLGIVPNHMAFHGPAVESVLADGPKSPYAHWFDVDWDAGGGRLVPPGQGEPNYRRFFDISGLIALRQEDPDVFDATHALIIRLVRDGLVDGLRIDHLDGLTDPRAYLRRLSDRIAPGHDRSDHNASERDPERNASERGPERDTSRTRRWILVEKITARGEELPAGWVCAGTTGYDALGMVGGLFLDPAGERALTEIHARLTGRSTTFAEVERASRRHAAEHTLRPEVDRLHRVLVRARPSDDSGALRDALLELLVAIKVYRAYVVPGAGPSDQALRVLTEAARRCRAPLVPAVVREALYGDPEFVVRFQQVSAPLAAKGVEDTAFYRWSRLSALNEVGGDPARFAVAPAEFHAFCRRVAADWPLTMTTLSTHDTKRQEDVRARLAVLAEIPDAWEAAVTGWRAPSSPLEPDLEQLMWQTLVGAWPITEDRMSGYLLKAMREAKTTTNWITPNKAYEQQVLRHLHTILASRIPYEIARFVARIEPWTRANVLGQKIVQLTMPGVPDLYQGCELVGRALVDPDNRRPVDFGRRRARLARLDDNRAPGGLDDEKLLVTSRALRLRRDRPAWFAPPGPHEPLTAVGPAADHVVAFRRGRALTLATRLPATLERRGGWASTLLAPHDGRWRDVLTGYVHEGPQLDLAAVLDRLPVALLVPEGAV